MKNLAAALALSILCSASWAQSTYVKPHVRKDGTFVDGHYRSKPNSTVDDNYGTKGNYNPYTGQEGTQPRSYEQPSQQPRTNTYGTDCGYTASGRYVCR